MRQVALFLRWVGPLVVALLVMAALLYGCRASVVRADPADADGSTFLVSVRSGMAEDRVLADLGLAVVDRIPQLGVVVVAPRSLPPTLSETERDDRDSQLVTQLNKRPEVAWAEVNRTWAVTPVVEAFDGGLAALGVSDPLAGQQYSLDRMQVAAAWDASRGDGVTVAVLDTGADFSHPDLAGKFVSRGKDFVNGDDDATDDHGHGTHVAGILGAATNNGVGMAGVGYNVRVLPGKVLGANGSGATDGIARGIVWAADQGARVINMSLGGSGVSPTLEQAVNYAWGKGAVVVCAAGNDGTSVPQYPAAYTNCVSVAATDQADRRASFSNYSSTVDVAAPGVQVLGTVRGGRYEAWSGTSMATPNVAGVAALIAAAHPTWTNGQIRAALEQTADEVGGWKRVNAARAVGAPAGPTLTPAPTVNWPTATPAPDRDGQIVVAINQRRAAQGLGGLVVDPALTRIAREHNQFMDEHNCFAHECPGEETLGQRLARAGYGNFAGSETIARGYDSVNGLVDGWMNSNGHRAILLGDYTMVGCAWDELDSGYMGRWMTCDFGRRAGAQPTPTPVPDNGLPRGWRMLVYLPRSGALTIYDYDDPTVTKTLTDAVYRHVCQDLASQGARCQWVRK